MLVTKKAPDFTATTVLGNNEIIEEFNLYDNFGENGTVLYSILWTLPLFALQRSSPLITD